jgi:predicted lipid-binding transport protein (Tim44 family)
MHDLGAIIWLILVLIGVISSVRKNARRAAQQRSAGPPPRSAMAQAVLAQAFAAPPAIVPPPVPAPAVTPAPAPAAAPVATARAPVSDAHATPLGPVGTSPIRGMFEGPATLVRAIVAAEVLGPPKSMQEQTIWSPRHSEPSI